MYLPIAAGLSLVSHPVLSPSPLAVVVFLAAICFAAVLAAFTRWFWRFGLRRYSGASA